MDVVRRVRRACGSSRSRKLKVGHAGTLDPLATGVVVCCVGRATRCVEHLMGMPKVYEAQVDLSAFTATDDLEGDRQEVPIERPPVEEDVRNAVRTFLGSIQQRPPAHSAVHVQGRRAYDLARRGVQFEIPLKTVRIDAIEVLTYQWPRVDLRVTCGRGTYIRSLARDLGRALGTGGHLSALRRTAVGPYDLGIGVDAERLGEPITQKDLLPMPGE